MTDKLNQFVGQRYMSLETYRRNGAPVRTPVWFVEHNGQLMFYTMAASGKAKRLRRERRVRVAPCDARGNLKGAWLEGSARLLESKEARELYAMLNRKYGWQRRLINLLAWLRSRPRAGYAIRFT
jgi:PPOX class probable F420-dependent enzyme